MWREMQRLARDESGKVGSEHRIQGLLGFIEEPRFYNKISRKVSKV